VYLRHSVRRKDGKTHVYWRLVRSVRRNGKVIQETVAQLGELDGEGRAKAEALARTITGRADQPELFEEAKGHSTSVAVRLDRIRLERGRAFGDVWLGWTLWRALRLDELTSELLPEGREDIPWAAMAAVLVVARLCRALDKLLPHKEAIERHLVKRLGELFALDYDLLLYDVTSTYFEGLCEKNELAQRGYSRDHRPDCKQVCLALVVTREGMPLGYELFAGNRVDVTTVEEIVETMEARYGLAQRIWVMDRGMTSAENVAWLQETGRRYLIGTPRGEVKRWSRELADAADWRTIRDGVEAKLCSGPGGAETFLLCRSVERREKEKAMHERFSARIEEGLKRLGRRLERSRLRLDRGPIERRIGRLLEQNRRAAGRYTIQLVDDSALPSGHRLTWSARAEWDDWARASEGAYVLRTNVTDWTPENLWSTYVQLTEAEAAFRIQKSDLSLRPIWHQKADRVKAHILVCFLAYVLWKTLEQWQRRAGLGSSPRTILDELARIQSTDVVLPLANGSRREVRLRCVVRPDKAQAMLLDRLGLTLPERLRIPPAVARM